MGATLTIARKELGTLFTQPIAYVVLVCFLMLSGLFFFLILQEYGAALQEYGWQMPELNVTEYVLSEFFGLLSVLILFIIPFVTMRTYAEERKQGTDELLLTAPIRVEQVVWGKFLGTLIFFCIALALTLPGPLLLRRLSDPDLGVMLSGYLGLLLMGGAFIATGCFISSLTKNQIVAAVLTFAAFLMLWIVSALGEHLASDPSPLIFRLSQLLSYISLNDHFPDFINGLIDTRHLVYFVSFILLFNFLSQRSLESARWRA
ncbi:MAG: ABC transporter permease [Candidatus Alcyoniella australis]|nr:ABC transporter permease [Candidatus Alcyoniella australis]